jgi:hypothetical protein
MCTSSAPDVDPSLPEWMTLPDCPEWARRPRYFDVDAVTALEIRRGFVDQRTINARLYRRKYNARKRAERPPAARADRMLAKLKAHVSMWRNHITRAEAAEPGSMEAAQAMLALPSYRAHLAEAQRELSAYVESALCAELACDE